MCLVAQLEVIFSDYLFFSFFSLLLTFFLFRIITCLHPYILLRGFLFIFTENQCVTQDNYANSRVSQRFSFSTALMIVTKSV